MISRASFARDNLTAREFVQEVQRLVYEETDEELLEYVKNNIDVTEYADRRMKRKLERKERRERTRELARNYRERLETQATGSTTLPRR